MGLGRVWNAGDVGENMAIFNFDDNEALGSVIAVDTATVTIRVDDIERLRRIQVNRLVVRQCSKATQHLIGVVNKITRRADDREVDEEVDQDVIDRVFPENNLVKITLIGTLLDRDGEKENVFRRTLETVPEIDANCFSLEGDKLTKFMQVISNVEFDGPKLSIGRFTLDDEAEAFLNGNKLFQRTCCHCWQYRVRKIMDDCSFTRTNCSTTTSKCGAL